MAPAEPLFANNRRDSSIHSEERAADEDTALLGGRRKDSGSPLSRASFWREAGLFTWALIATAACIVLAVFTQHQGLSHGSGSDHQAPSKPTGKRNLIFMVSDGMGPASLSMTRSFRQLRGMISTCSFRNLLTIQMAFLSMIPSS